MKLDFSNFELDHIGIAVESIEDALVFYNHLGFQKYEIEEVPTERVRVCFLKLKNQVNVELLEATSDNSPIAKYILKRGAGIHHMCYRVQNIEDLIKKYLDCGIQMIDQVPRIGAHNCKVAFIHPKASGGVLIELSEKMRDA